MRILSIAGKEIKQNIRNTSVMLIMTLMPIILILILGAAFNGSFSGSSMTLGNLHIEYMVRGEAGGLTGGFEDVMGKLLEGENNSLTEVHDAQTALVKVKDADISSFIIIDETAEQIIIHKNSLYNLNASLVEGVIRTYAGRYNAIMEIINVNPAAMAGIQADRPTGDYIQQISVNQKEKPSAMDYYGITMVCVFVLYGIMTPSSSIISEKNNGTGSRIICSSTPKYQYFIGKVLGALGITVLQIGLVILFSSQVFGVNWGDQPLYPVMLIFSLVVMAISLGTGIGFIFKEEGPAMSMLHVFIVIMSFFGGAYLSLLHMGGLAEIGRYFSPIWWVNTGIFNQIYTGDMTAYWTSMTINLGIAVVFFVIAIWKMNQREGFVNG